MKRSKFREAVFGRDNGTCTVPWCGENAVDAHHIYERELWDNGGYIPENGASVCEKHHKMAEKNEIPPQAFHRWIGVEDPPLPNGVDSIHVNKWGDSWSTPDPDDLRDYQKYPSTKHLIPLYHQSSRGKVDDRTGRDDTGLTSVDSFLDIPLVATIKMDGSNALLVSDKDEPVRARNAREASLDSFDYLKQEYWERNVYGKLPEHLQVFGENMYAKHSIHYGCSACCDERNQGPTVDDVFVVFGVYDTRYDLWLSWPETEEIAEQIGFPTAPVVDETSIDVDDDMIGSVADNDQLFKTKYTTISEDIVDEGHEGIIVRSMYPFHYDQFTRKLGKYVRPNHVQTPEHWTEQPTVRNVIK